MENAIGMVGVLIAASHLVFVGLLVVWFALGKPTSWALVRPRLGAMLHGKPMPVNPRKEPRRWS